MNCNAVMKKASARHTVNGARNQNFYQPILQRRAGQIFTVTSGFFYHMMDVSMNRVQSEQKEMVKSEGIGA